MVKISSINYRKQRNPRASCPTESPKRAQGRNDCRETQGEFARGEKETSLVTYFYTQIPHLHANYWGAYFYHLLVG